MSKTSQFQDVPNTHLIEIMVKVAFDSRVGASVIGSHSRWLRGGDISNSGSEFTHQKPVEVYFRATLLFLVSFRVSLGATERSHSLVQRAKKQCLLKPSDEQPFFCWTQRPVSSLCQVV